MERPRNKLVAVLLLFTSFCRRVTKVNEKWRLSCGGKTSDCSDAPTPGDSLNGTEICTVRTVTYIFIFFYVWGYILDVNINVPRSRLAADWPRIRIPTALDKSWRDRVERLDPQPVRRTSEQFTSQKRKRKKKRTERPCDCTPCRFLSLTGKRGRFNECVCCCFIVFCARPEKGALLCCPAAS